MTELREGGDTGVLSEMASMPEDVRLAVAEKVATQPGTISDDEFEQALHAGWLYGSEHTDNSKPEQRVVSDMARTICGIGKIASIDTCHYVPVLLTVDLSARAAKYARASQEQKSTGLDTKTDI